MTTHSSTLAWKIPWTEEPGGLQSMGLQLSDFTFTFHFHALEKEMATHPSVLAWRIPGTVEPGGLPPMGSHRVGHDWSDLAAAAAVQTAKFINHNCRCILGLFPVWGYYLTFLCIYSNIQGKGSGGRAVCWKWRESILWNTVEYAVQENNAYGPPTQNSCEVGILSNLSAMWSFLKKQDKHSGTR